MLQVMVAKGQPLLVWRHSYKQLLVPREPSRPEAPGTAGSVSHL
jgi:hypothetical protein